MSLRQRAWIGPVVAGAAAVVGANEGPPAPSAGARMLGSLHGMNSSVALYANGDYAITAAGAGATVMRSDVQADVDGRVLASPAFRNTRWCKQSFRTSSAAARCSRSPTRASRAHRISCAHGGSIAIGRGAISK